MLLDKDEDYKIHFGDCIPHMAEMPENSIDFSVFSPPFPSLYSYTALPEDIGNSENLGGDAKVHLSFFFKQLLRVMKPGRVAIVHVAQLPIRKKDDDEMGLRDFRGMVIRLAKRSGFIYDYDWVVTKNPQVQAIRTHSQSLLFVSLERDSIVCRGALGDYLIKIRKPGENKEPIKAEVSRNEWIKWAEAAWTNIRATNTLNTKEAKGEDDTRHICLLQLDVIERTVKLFSNKGDIVFSPFAGIGSEGYVALKLNRRFYGCEIKDDYYDTAIKNLEIALRERSRTNLGFLNGKV